MPAAFDSLDLLNLVPNLLGFPQIYLNNTNHLHSLKSLSISQCFIILSSIFSTSFQPPWPSHFRRLGRQGPGREVGGDQRGGDRSELRRGADGLHVVIRGLGAAWDWEMEKDFGGLLLRIKKLSYHFMKLKDIVCIIYNII